MKKSLFFFMTISMCVMADDDCTVVKKSNKESASKLQKQIIEKSEDIILECSKLMKKMGDVLNNVAIDTHNICAENEKAALKVYNQQLEKLLENLQICNTILVNHHSPLKTLSPKSVEGK